MATNCKVLAWTVLIAYTSVHAIASARTRSGPVSLDSLANESELLRRKIVNTNRKVLNLIDRVDVLERTVARLDQVKGILRDKPPCPVQANDFYHISELNTCYYFDETLTMMNATEAARVCTSRGPNAHLVAIETEEEQDWLRAMWNNEFGNTQLARFWTSALMRPNNDWIWTHNNARLKYTNWIPTSSHDDPDFQCMAVYANEAYYWIEVACWGPHAIACEINL